MYTKHFEFYAPLSLGRPFPEVFFQKNVKKRPTNQTPRHHRFLFQKQQKQLVRSASPRRTSKNIQIFTHLHFNSINHEQGGVKFHSWVPWLRIQMGRDGKVFPEKAHSGRGRIMGSWCDRERKSGNFRCRIKNVGWHFQENARSSICQSQTTSLEENRRVLIFSNCDGIIYG